MQKRSTFLSLAIFLPPGLVLLLYSYLGAFSRLMADDFCSVYDARRFTLLRYIWYWYITWGGRYSAIATDSVIKVLGAAGLPFVPFIILLVWVLVTSFTCYILLQHEKLNGAGLLLSLSLGTVLVFLVLLVSPKSQQVLYWWNGMRTYVPALISFTFQIGFLYWVSSRLADRKVLVLACAASFLIALFTGGYNETFTTVQFSFFTGLAVLALLGRRLRFSDRASLLLYAAVAGSAAALIIMMTSPGAARRQAYFPPPPHLLGLLTITLKGYASYLAELLSAPANILGLLGLLAGSMWIGARTGDRASSAPWALLSLLAGLFLAFVSLLPSVYGTSEMPAPRTFIVPSFILVTSLFYTGLMGGSWLRGFSTNAGYSSVEGAFVILAGIAFLLSSGLFAASLYSQRGVYIGFAQRWDQTNAQIIQAKTRGDASVSIAAPRNWAGLEEPNNRPKYWVTSCYTRYYGIQVLGPDPDQPQP